MLALRALRGLGVALPSHVYREMLIEAAEMLEAGEVPGDRVDPAEVVLAASTPALVEQCLV